MHSSIVIATVLAAIALTCTSAASVHRVRRQVVPPELAKLDLDQYLKNQRAVVLQIKCVIYGGPCDRIGKYLRMTIPEMIVGSCKNCSSTDRRIAGTIVAHIQKNYPKEWHDAVRKYQGGETLKPEDAARLEAVTGVKVDSSLIAES